MPQIANLSNAAQATTERMVICPCFQAALLQLMPLNSVSVAFAPMEEGNLDLWEKFNMLNLV